MSYQLGIGGFGRASRALRRPAGTTRRGRDFAGWSRRLVALSGDGGVRRRSVVRLSAGIAARRRRRRRRGCPADPRRRAADKGEAGEARRHGDPGPRQADLHAEARGGGALLPPPEKPMPRPTAPPSAAAAGSRAAAGRRRCRPSRQPPSRRRRPSRKPRRPANRRAGQTRCDRVQSRPAGERRAAPGSSSVRCAARRRRSRNGTASGGPIRICSAACRRPRSAPISATRACTTASRRARSPMPTGSAAS